LGTSDEALGQVWFAPSNAPLTQAEFVGLIETELSGQACEKSVRRTMRWNKETR
jgi:hypothetical protein